MADRISVAVRSRPIEEKKNPGDGSFFITDNEREIIVKGKKFCTDFIFQDSTNEELYGKMIYPKMEKLFKGANMTIIGYGATGSGKTHTLGTNIEALKGNSEPGITQLCIQEIFNKTRERDPACFVLKISFLEVYGEEVRDLLQCKSGATSVSSIRQDMDGFKVSNLTEIEVSNLNEVFAQLRKGCFLRKTGATARNPKSSRSHGIFTVIIEAKEKENAIQRSKLLIVDLAGSERIDTSQTTGQSLKEGININVGLMTLRKVIKALAEKQQHIPFRDSKLTKILQESLEGNSQTLMIACIHPTYENLEETLSTLRYASLATSIVLKEKAVPPHIQIGRLKNKILDLQDALKRKQFSEGLPVTCDAATQMDPSVDLFYVKYVNSQKAMSKFHEKYQKKRKMFQALYDKLQTLEKKIEFGSEFENQLDKDENKLEISKLFQDIFTACVTLVAEETWKTEDLNDKVLICSNSEDSASLSEQINEISEQVSSNERTVKNLEEMALSVEEINQDVVSNLVLEIERLTVEKDHMKESMTGTVEKSTKTEDLEKKIKKLQSELEDKKYLLQKKEASKNEINRLKKENDSLKLFRSTLVKEIKQSNTRFSQFNVQKKREISQLLKDSRKKEALQCKENTQLRTQIKVLQKKLNLISQENISKGPSGSTSKKESLETRIKNLLDSVISKKTKEVLNRNTENEVKSLFHSLRQCESDAETVPLEDKEDYRKDIEVVKFYYETVISKTAEEIQVQQATIDTLSKQFVMSMSSMEEAKQGISILLKEFLALYEKVLVEKHNQHKEYEEKITDMENKRNLDQQLSNDKVNYLTIRNEEMQEINKELSQKVQSLSEKLELVQTLEGEPQLIEKVKLQEQIISELRGIIDNYKKNDLEMKSLSKDLFHAKKGKSSTWLKKVSPKEEDTSNLMNEFLDETIDESFNDDQNDPDWRATPLWKRNKEKLVRKMPESSEDESPPKKKYLTESCSCSGGCRTMRCQCRKNEKNCSSGCSCHKNCTNLPDSSSQ